MRRRLRRPAAVAARGRALGVVLVVAAAVAAYVLRVEPGDVSNPDVEFERGDDRAADRPAAPSRGRGARAPAATTASRGRSTATHEGPRTRYLPLRPAAAPAVRRAWAVHGPHAARVPARALRALAVPAQEQRRAVRDLARGRARSRWKRKLGYLAARLARLRRRHDLRGAARARQGQHGGRVVALDAKHGDVALVAAAAQPRRSPRRCSTTGASTSAPRTGRSTRCARATARCAGRTRPRARSRAALALDRGAPVLRRLQRAGLRDPPRRRQRAVGDRHRAAARVRPARRATSTRRPRSPTAASTSAPPTASSTRSAPADGKLAWRHSRPAATSTPRPRSRQVPGGGRRSTSAPTTATSTRSTRARAACAGRRAPAARSPAAPAVIGDLVFFSNLGRKTTAALGAATGKRVWTTGRGAFNPVVSDGRAIYFIGYSSLFMLSSRRQARADARARRASARRAASRPQVAAPRRRRPRALTASAPSRDA